MTELLILLAIFVGANVGVVAGACVAYWLFRRSEQRLYERNNRYAMEGYDRWRRAEKAAQAQRDALVGQ